MISPGQLCSFRQRYGSSIGNGALWPRVFCPRAFRLICGEKDQTVLMNVTHSFYFELIAEMGTAGLILITGIIYFNWRDLGLVKRIVARTGHT